MTIAPVDVFVVCAEPVVSGGPPGTTRCDPFGLTAFEPKNSAVPGWATNGTSFGDMVSRMSNTFVTVMGSASPTLGPANNAVTAKQTTAEQRPKLPRVSVMMGDCLLVRTTRSYREGVMPGEVVRTFRANPAKCCVADIWAVKRSVRKRVWKVLRQTLHEGKNIEALAHIRGLPAGGYRQPGLQMA